MSVVKDVSVIVAGVEILYCISSFIWVVCWCFEIKSIIFFYLLFQNIIHWKHLV